MRCSRNSRRTASARPKDDHLMRRALYGAARCCSTSAACLDAVEAAERLTPAGTRRRRGAATAGEGSDRSVQRPCRARSSCSSSARTRARDDAALLTELGCRVSRRGRSRHAAEQRCARAIDLDEFAVAARAMLGKMLADEPTGSMKRQTEFRARTGAAAELWRGRVRAAELELGERQ